MAGAKVCKCKGPGAVEKIKLEHVNSQQVEDIRLQGDVGVDQRMP